MMMVPYFIILGDDDWSIVGVNFTWLELEWLERFQTEEEKAEIFKLHPFLALDSLGDEGWKLLRVNRAA